MIIEVHQGRKGDKGDAGATGPTGATGATGETGPAWSVGVDDGRVPARSGAGTVNADMSHIPDSSANGGRLAMTTDERNSLASASSALTRITARTVDVRESRFGGSCDGRTTTTVGTTAPGTSVILAADIGLTAGQGVYLAGAGASGGNYIGTVVSCVGTALTVTPSTSTSVSAGTAVEHDDTEAWLAAFSDADAAGGSTTITFDGISRIHGPFLDLTGSKAMLPLPSKFYGVGFVAMQIWIKGLSKPATTDQGGAICGAILDFGENPALSGGCMIGGYCATSQYGNKTGCFFGVEDLTIRCYANPHVNGLDGRTIGRVQTRGSVVFETHGLEMPTVDADWFAYATPGAFAVPPNDNSDITVRCWHGGVRMGERAHVGHLYTSKVRNPVRAEAWDNTIDKMVVDVAVDVFTGTDGSCLKVGFAAIDQVSNSLLNDPSGYVAGEINYIKLDGVDTVIGGSKMLSRNMATVGSDARSLRKMSYWFEIKPASPLVVADAVFDLANAPAAFWSAVRSDGGDIRVYQRDGVTQCAREVVGFSLANKAGIVYFAPGAGTSFYFFAGEGTAEPSYTSTYGARNVWESSIAGVWHMASNADATGHYADLGGGHPPTRVSGKIGNCGDFGNGQADNPHYMSLGPYSHDVGTGDFALSAWAYPTDYYANLGASHTNASVMCVGFASPCLSTSGNWGTKHALGFYWDTFHDFGVDVPLNQWNHIWLVRRSGIIYGYLNGSVAPSSVSLGTSLENGNIAFGANASGSLDQFGGKIDEGRFYKRAPSDAEIAQLYAIQNAPASFWTIVAT